MHEHEYEQWAQAPKTNTLDKNGPSIGRCTETLKLLSLSYIVALLQTTMYAMWRELISIFQINNTKVSSNLTFASAHSHWIGAKQSKQVIKTCCKSCPHSWRLNEYHNEITANQITYCCILIFDYNFSRRKFFSSKVQSGSFNCKHAPRWGRKACCCMANEVKTTKRCPRPTKRKTQLLITAINN